LLHLGAGFLVSALVLDDYHFLSDVLWGGAMGYAVGTWVIRNRSSRYSYGSDGQSLRLTLIPLRSQEDSNGALGLAFSF
jgi:hypothetical protein